MSAEPEVVIDASAQDLVDNTVARVVATLQGALAERDVAHLIITGGGIMEQLLGGLGSSPLRDSIEWSRVHVWWGDERYVPADSPDRNDLPARRLLLDHVAVDPDKIHPMPASDAGFGDDVEAAADSYAAELASVVPEGSDEDVPTFDLALLGVGPDGHTASLFPEAPGTLVTDATVIAVRNSPKPPPVRLSLTFPTLDSANQVWFVVSGVGKADALALAFSGAGPEQVPSGAVRGIERTLWLADRDAASKLPASVPRLPVS